MASPDPFAYAGIESEDHWDYRTIAGGRVTGDPYVALTDLARQIVPTGEDDWDYDITPYYVQQRYDYPRFVCYDCHAYASYSYWDPYAYSCTRFRVVVYDDPYYYPYRYYAGTRVVFSRPARPEPRFIFKERGGTGGDDDRFVTRVRERPVNDDSRRGVTGRDLGGRGIIQPPRERSPEGRPEGRPGDVQRDRGRDHPQHPDHPNNPHHPDRPDRPDRPGSQDRPDSPGRRERPQGPDHQPPARPVQPPPERRGEDRSRSAPHAEPRSQPPPPPAQRGEPRRDSGSKDKGQSQPELRRRKP